MTTVAYLIGLAVGLGWGLFIGRQRRRPQCEICGKPAIGPKTRIESDHKRGELRLLRVILCRACLNESQELDAAERRKQ